MRRECGQIERCRNSAEHPAETDGGTSIDPSAAITARRTMVDFRRVASAAAEEIAVLPPVLRDSSGFRGRPNAKGRSVKKPSPQSILDVPQGL
jgi:hypothetical protein